MNFETLDYLKTGTPRQQEAYRVLPGIFEVLKDFAPLLAGTIPIGIDLPESDLDIICTWGNRTQGKEQFVHCLQKGFYAHIDYRLWDGEYRGYNTVVANFKAEGFAIEIFGQVRPVKEQEAYRHMLVEHSLLERHGESLRNEVMKLKKTGIKTEPAFAQALGLTGDSYEALLKLPE